METSKVDSFMIANGKFFPSAQIPMIRSRMLAMDDSKSTMLFAQQFKDPTTSLIISIVAGAFGIDRFIIGDTGIGIGKLLTLGGCGIWTIVDWFMIQDATRQKNMEMLQIHLH